MDFVGFKPGTQTNDLATLQAWISLPVVSHPVVHLLEELFWQLYKSHGRRTVEAS